MDRKIYQWYCYLFYQDYLWQVKRWKDWGSPELAATYALATTFFFNVFSLIIFLQIVFGHTFLEILFRDKLHFFILVGIPVMILHETLFVRKNRYKKIIQYYEKYPLISPQGI